MTASTTGQATRPSVTSLPPAALAALAALAQRLLTPRARPRTSTTAPALLIAASSAALGAAAGWTFARTGTTVNPVNVDHSSALVTTGAHRISRNPMYVAMAGLLIAHALHRRSLLATLPVAGMLVAIDRVQIPREESALRAQFGGAYTRYCADVPRWLGPRHC